MRGLTGGAVTTVAHGGGGIKKRARVIGAILVIAGLSIWAVTHAPGEGRSPSRRPGPSACAARPSAGTTTGPDRGTDCTVLIVNDAGDALPAAHVTVCTPAEAGGISEVTESTGPDGNARIQVALLGWIVAEHPGYAPAGVPATGAPAQRIVLRPTGMFAIRVVDTAGRPVPHATVRLLGGLSPAGAWIATEEALARNRACVAVSNLNGVAELPFPRPGLGWQVQAYTDRLFGQGWIGGLGIPPEITVREFATAVVQVRDAASGEAIPAVVTTDDGGGTASRTYPTDSRGVCSLPCPQEGQIKYVVRASGHQSDRFAIRPGDQSREIGLQPARRLVLRVQSDGGRPSPGADVGFYPFARRSVPGAWEIAGRDGTAAFDLTAGPGKYWAMARSESMTGATFIDKAGSLEEAVVALVPAGACDVLVQDAHGCPLDDVVLCLAVTRGPGGASWRTWPRNFSMNPRRTGNRGRARFELLPIGAEAKLLAIRRDLGTARAEVSIEQRDQTVTMVLDPLAPCKVMVRDQGTGEVVPGARIRVASLQGGKYSRLLMSILDRELEATTSGDGSAVIGLPFRRDWRVEVAAQGYIGKGILVKAGTQSISLALRRYVAIRGILRGASGLPSAFRRVHAWRVSDAHNSPAYLRNEIADPLQRHTARVGDDGAFEIPFLIPGLTYHLAPGPMRFMEGQARDVKAPASDVRIEAQARAYCSLEIHAPAVGGRYLLLAWSDSQGRRSGQIAYVRRATGSAELLVPRERLWATVYVPDAFPHTGWIDARDGTARIEAPIRPGRVAVRVLDAASHPVRGAKLIVSGLPFETDPTLGAEPVPRGEFTAFTSADGRAEVAFPPGDWRAIAKKGSRMSQPVCGRGRSPAELVVILPRE